MPITATRMGHLWDALSRADAVLGLDAASGGDEVFGQLVRARIIEPSGKLDAARVIAETGQMADPASGIRVRCPPERDVPLRGFRQRGRRGSIVRQFTFLEGR